MKSELMMKLTVGGLIGLLSALSLGADSLLEGHVRLPSGAPVPGAQVLLFDLSDLRAAPLAATTDRSGQFTLPFARDRALPQGFELGANYPNPFNPSTMIPYQLPAAMHVRLEVFNVLGQRVATLVDGEQPAGFHTASWNATDVAGEAVAAGVYLYRLSGDGVRTTRSMVLIDGQAGIPSGGGGSTGLEGEDGAGEKVRVYGLTVSGPGLVPYVDPAFRVEAGRDLPDLVVEAPERPSAKAASAGGILGDVDNTGSVDFFDALLVALYSRDSGIVLPNNGDISLGDVNADGQVDLTDAWLIAAYLDDPSDPSLPAGIGEPVGPAASLSPDPSTVTFSDDGAWHRFTVEAGEPVTMVANPEGTTPRLEITSFSVRSNFCPAEAGDDVSRRDGQAVYLAGCATGPATVELRRSDGTVLNTYTFEVTGSSADLVVESVSVSDSTLTPGQSFTLSATVRNQGTGQSAAATLHYYRSSNRTISTQDTRVGTDPVGALGGSRTSAESISLTAPSSAGTYYYGACVASVSDEGDTQNNCSPGVAVTVTARSDGGDRGDGGGTPKMYWTDWRADKIQCADLDGSNLQTLVTTGDWPLDIALDVGRGKMYWRDTGNIRRANLDGSNLQDLVTTGSVAHIALDVGSDKIYWTNWRTWTIQRANLDGSDVQTLVGLANPPVAIALDVGSGKIYWTTEEPGSIQRADLDGSNRQTLVTGLHIPKSIALDVDSGKMYWTDARTNKIQRANLDGSNLQDLVITGLLTPYGIALDVGSGKMYWTSKDAGHIGRADLDGSNLQTLLTGLPQPVGIALDTSGASGDGSTGGDGTVTIPDANLRAAIEQALGKSPNAPITRAEMATLTRLDARDRDIRDLTGLESATSLTTLYFGGNRLSDISVLSSLTNLTHLGFQNSNISDISPLLGLTNLTHLWIDDNSISDISPLSGLTNLTYLQVTDNNISDILPLVANTGLGSGDRVLLSGNPLSSTSRNTHIPALRSRDVTVLFVDSGGSSPDLLVESPSVSDSTLTTGQSFTLSATVRNSGTGQSAATTLRYYQSSDATISTSDTQVGTDSVDGLSASGISAESISLTAPSSAGTYYYGACIESVSSESNTTNNCSAGVTVAVSSSDGNGGTAEDVLDELVGIKLQRANLDGSNVQDIVTAGLGTPRGIVLDVVTGKMYWTDSFANKIQCANLDGSNVQDLVTTGLYGPRDIALDVSNGKIYWTDTDDHGGKGKIQRANLDGSNVQDIVEGLPFPNGIALDVSNGKIYWTDLGSDKIQRANLDGSNLQDLITVQGPNGIALDVSNGKIYWTASFIMNKIQRANLDGSNVQDLVTTGLVQPYGIALDVSNGQIYWTDSFTDKIQRANLDGSNVQDLVTTGLDEPLDIALDTSGGRVERNWFSPG